MEWEVLLKSLVDNIKTLAEKQTKIEEKLANYMVNDTKHDLQLQHLKEQCEHLKTKIEVTISRLQALETSKTELNGFAKYAKLIWIAVAGVIGYLCK